MQKLSCSLLLFSTILLLGACGGGSSDSGSAGPTPTPVVPDEPSFSEIIQNAQEYSRDELKSAAVSLAKIKYSGQEATAKLSLASAQTAFQALSRSTIFYPPAFYPDSAVERADSNGEIDFTLECYYQGSVSYVGKLDANGLGNISAYFSNCEQQDRRFALTGRLAFSIEKYTEDSANISIYYDNLTWPENSGKTSVSGAFYIDFSYNEQGDYISHQEVDIAFDFYDKTNIRFDGVLSRGYKDNDYSVEYAGDLFLEEYGKISVSVEGVKDLPPYVGSGKLTLVGDRMVAFDFDNSPYVLYKEDTDGDSVFDVGTYFGGYHEILDANVEEKKLVSLNQLSLPPEVGAPNVPYNEGYYATTDIAVEPGYFYDQDTPAEQLIVSFRWYLNDELLTDYTSNVLPAGIAVFGDKLQASMVVSDGANSVESRMVVVTILDSPTTVTLQNIPEIINTGDDVQFNVQIFDPDIGDVDGQVVYLSGPEGVVIENGVVSWKAPSDMLFSVQSYDFTFGISNENSDTILESSVTLKVSSNKDVPLARSSLDVPFVNNSMSVGDFDGDGKNEVLVGSGSGLIYLLENSGDSYHQKWVFPYKVPSEGKVRQVLSANVDQDAELEIIVITEHGISVVDSLNSEARLIAKIEGTIIYADVYDIDSDGDLELAFLSEPSYGSDNTLKVMSLSNPEEYLFELSASGANYLAFGNVDNDKSVELVLNTGLVYETATWENQWFSGTEFGGSFIAVGDYNGDGIAEIAGADRWGDIIVFDAVNKVQIDSFDNFNTCALLSADINNNGRDELIVGDCQWGNISAYTIENDQLSESWAVDMQGHGSISLAAGDSDNDNAMELHWGTGISSSGEDNLVIADVTSNNATVKESAITLQLDSFSIAGWSSITSEDDEKAVFFVPSTSSGYGGSVIAMMDPTGQYEVSKEISSNWDNSRYAVTTDFNNDGFGDIFLPHTETYDGSFAAMQLSDTSVHWQTSGSYDSNIGLIKAVDLNQDDSDDALYIDNRSVKAIDVFNQQLLATYSFDSNLNDVVAYESDGEAIAFAATYSKLHHLKKVGGSFSEVAFVEQECNKIALFNYDQNADKELICLNSNSYSGGSEFVIYAVTDQGLTELSRYNSAQYVVDFSIDPSSDVEQNLLLAVLNGNNYSYWDDNNRFSIQLSTALGRTIWRSPALASSPVLHGMKARVSSNGALELMLATHSMMYWIK